MAKTERAGPTLKRRAGMATATGAQACSALVDLSVIDSATGHEPGRRPRPFPASGHVPDPPGRF